MRRTAHRFLDRCLAIAAVYCLAILSVPTLTSAEPFFGEVETNFDGNRYEVRFRVSLSARALSFGHLSGFDTVEMEGFDHLTDPGKPRLPARTVRVAIPEGMRVTGIRSASVESIALPGTYTIYPAQWPQPIGPPLGDSGTFAEPNPSVYASPDVYPSRWVALTGQADLAGQNLAILQVLPLRYSPAAGRLTRATSMEVILEGEPGRICGDYLPSRISEGSRAAYERILEETVMNPADVELQVSGAGRTRGVEPGEFDYVIITQPAWVDDFQPLADWRTRQGLRSTVVSTDWIYSEGGYTGSDLDRVRAFIVDAHTNWGAMYFVLGADAGGIPYHVRTVTTPIVGYEVAYIRNDTYYADFDDDWILEVHVGRVSVGTSSQIVTVIDKILTYEKNPPLAGYVTEAALFGFDITTCGDQSGELWQENYIRPYLSPGWSLSTEYDSEPGLHKADVLAYLDYGHHIVNHDEHCNYNAMATGWTCHGQLMYVGDVDALTNGDRLSILLAVGCHPCDFPALPKCIAEAFLRNANGGGVAFLGNTNVGWGGYVEDPDYYSLRQNHYFFRNLFDLDIYRLGDNITRLKNDAYDPYDPYNLNQWCFTQYHLIGDPGLTVWTHDPGTLTVTHGATLTAGLYTTFPVDVADGGTPVDGATVCLWKDGDVYEVVETAGGVASFGFVPESQGILYVTVCAHDFLPYEGQADVQLDPTSVSPETSGLPAQLEIVSIVPNPFNPVTEVTYAIPQGSTARAKLAVYNSLGQHVRTLVDGPRRAGFHKTIWNGTDARGIEVAAGVYFCELRWNGERWSERMVLLK